MVHYASGQVQRIQTKHHSFSFSLPLPPSSYSPTLSLVSESAVATYGLIHSSSSQLPPEDTLFHFHPLLLRAQRCRHTPLGYCYCLGSASDCCDDDAWDCHCHYHARCCWHVVAGGGHLHLPSWQGQWYLTCLLFLLVLGRHVLLGLGWMWTWMWMWMRMAGRWGWGYHHRHVVIASHDENSSLANRQDILWSRSLCQQTNGGEQRTRWCVVHCSGCGRRQAERAEAEEVLEFQIPPRGFTTNISQ